MRTTTLRLGALASLVMLLAATLAAPPVAADEGFYSGKTVFVYVGRPPGSGADLAVRSFVRFWQEHIPGNPTMVVKNVPGGAGSRVWNLAWDKKQPDPLEIYFSPVSGTAIIVREKGLRAVLSQMPLVGALESPNMTFARTERLQKAEDLPGVSGLQFGGQAPAHRFSILGRLSLDILGVEYRNVSGFRGASDVFNALRRREVDIQTAPLNFYRFTVEPNVVASGEVIPLWYHPVYGEDGEEIPLEAAGDIPSFTTYYRAVKGGEPSGPLFDAYKWVLPHVNGIVYAAFLSPGAPEPIVQLLRDSFVAVTRDEAYLAEELKMFGFNLPVVGTAHATRMLKDMEQAPDNIRRFLDEYIEAGK